MRKREEEAVMDFNVKEGQEIKQGIPKVGCMLEVCLAGSSIGIGSEEWFAILVTEVAKPMGMTGLGLEERKDPCDLCEVLETHQIPGILRSKAKITRAAKQFQAMYKVELEKAPEPRPGRKEAAADEEEEVIDLVGWSRPGRPSRRGAEWWTARRRYKLCAALEDAAGGRNAPQPRKGTPTGLAPPEDGRGEKENSLVKKLKKQGTSAAALLAQATQLSVSEKRKKRRRDRDKDGALKKLVSLLQGKRKN
eukprot:s225_g47.t1